jgi:hypothetical protein
LEHGECKLEVTAAVRKNMDAANMSDDGIIIRRDEYKERLREQLILACEREKRSVGDTAWNVNNITIMRIESAKKSKRLMLADAVCNTWFAKKKDKLRRSDIRMLPSQQEKDFGANRY